MKALLRHVWPSPDLSETSSIPNAAGPGGDPPPSGSGRDHHAGPDWIQVHDQDLDQTGKERTALGGAGQSYAVSVLTVTASLSFAGRFGREAA